MAAAAAQLQAKPVNFAESIPAEQEQDANSALAELDKGLRSNRIGVQCEAIVKFPRLFEKYPFPILINSALLKIVDVFRGGNNFIRLCILRVVQQSEKHLDKILNVDEFLRRIYTVIYSNDPIARAITIRTLGSIASIIPEKKNVHHVIIQALDSHDAVEVEASIFAADKFSEKSKTFSATICGKMIAMLSGLATPVEMKMKLIPSLRHMHHDADTAAKAFAVCESLLEGYPAQNFVILTLNTMTQLAVQSLVSISSHTVRLLAILNSDLRYGVHMACLHNLRLLAIRGPHLWNNSSVEEVTEFLKKTTSLQLRVQSMCILNAICSSVAVKLLPLVTLNKVLSVARQFCYDENVSMAAKSVRLLTEIARSKRCNEDIATEAMSAIQTFLIISGSENDEGIEHLRYVLRAAVDLSELDAGISAAFVETLSGLLSISTGVSVEAVCETLAAIGDKNPEALQPAVFTIMSCLQRWSASGLGSRNVQVRLCTLIFQAAQENVIPMDILASMQVVIDKSGLWQMYRIARQAMRYGQYAIAHRIFSDLAYKMASEQFYNWLLGLRHICSAQLCLQELNPGNSSVLPCLASAIDCYQRALVSFKAASTPAYLLEFQCDYVRLRTSWLASLRFLIVTCNTFSSSPPPAIATAQASTQGREGQRWAQVLQQLEKCVLKCHETGQKIAALYWASFDADPSSLTNITLLQQSCDCIKSAISTIISTVNTGQSTLGERQYLGHLGAGSDPRSIRSILHKISNKLDTLLPEHSAPSIDKNYKLIDFLKDSATALVQASLSFPRFFFQTLQSTSVKLAISPQSSSGEPVTVCSNTNLALKVEGVIQRGDRPSLFRSVHAVSVTVVTSIISRAPIQSVHIKGDKGGVQLSQTVEPHNEYFSTSFILPFPVLGIHSVTIDAAIVDENGATWKTGPRAALTVKSYDDSVQRQQVPQSRGSRTAAAVLARDAAAAAASTSTNQN